MSDISKPMSTKIKLILMAIFIPLGVLFEIWRGVPAKLAIVTGSCILILGTGIVYLSSKKKR